MSLTFDEPSHVYRWNGEPVPNVTRILSGLTDYSRIPPERLEIARQEGKAVHKMVELECDDLLNVADLPEWLKPRFRAWNKFRSESGFVAFLSERPMYHPLYGYAGTPDLAGEAPRLKGVRGPVLLDIKRSLYGGPVIGLQTAAYAELLAADKAYPRIRHRFALVLGDDTYKLEPFTDESDKGAFLAFLTTHRWREKHGKHE